MIDRRPKGRRAVRANEVHEPLQVRTGERIRQKNVSSTGRRRHLGLGDGRALVLADPQRLFQPDSRRSAYFAQGGDRSTLANLGNGVFSLTDPSGFLTQFQNGKVAFLQDANGNRISGGYTGARHGL